MTQTAFAFDRVAALTVVDLCCGAGMASLGFEAAGCEVIGGVDIWAEAQSVLAAQYEGEPEMVDYEDGDPLGAVDIVITGPPCQDDSLANHDADKGRGEIKRWALDVARSYSPTWIVMEMVTGKWAHWARQEGARQVFKLKDCATGGYTTRTRWFAIWGPSDLDVPQLPESEWRGWGRALLIADGGAKLATEANSKAKRWRRAKGPSEPAGAVVGGDRRHVLRMSDGREIRLGPREAAALSGYPLMRFPEQLTDRQLQTMIGNGWPKSFGLAIGEALVRAGR
jgi:site-specific DNA-cytosine methylase